MSEQSSGTRGGGEQPHLSLQIGTRVTNIANVAPDFLHLPPLCQLYTTDKSVCANDQLCAPAMCTDGCKDVRPPDGRKIPPFSSWRELTRTWRLFIL